MVEEKTTQDVVVVQPKHFSARFPIASRNRLAAAGSMQGEPTATILKPAVELSALIRIGKGAGHVRDQCVRLGEPLAEVLKVRRNAGGGLSLLLKGFQQAESGVINIVSRRRVPRKSAGD